MSVRAPAMRKIVRNCRWSCRFSPTPGEAWTSSPPERSDDLRPADARQLEQLRRADRPGGEHDLAVGARFAAVAVDAVAHADRAPALEDQPLDMRAGDDAQIRTVEDRILRKPRAALQRRPRRWLTSK